MIMTNTQYQFSPRHPNAQKAMANWERKSQYLLREIVKFRTYIDTLATAQAQKQKIYAEREAREQQEMEESEKEAVATPKATEDDGANEASEPAPSKTMPNPALPAAFLLHP
jgi:protein-disulfide isomerase